jgi:hypothetical protein
MLVPDIKPKYTPSALPGSIASVFFPMLLSSSMRAAGFAYPAAIILVTNRIVKMRVKASVSRPIFPAPQVPLNGEIAHETARSGTNGRVIA